MQYSATFMAVETNNFQMKHSENSLIVAYQIDCGRSLNRQEPRRFY